MTGNSKARLHYVSLALVAALGVSGCASNPFQGSGFGGAFGGGTANNAGPVEPAADARGVIAFQDFQVVTTQEGDTISSVAGRVGLDPQVLARYNGLPVSYALRPGERLAVPDGAQIAAVEEGWTPDIVVGALDRVPDGASSPAATEPPGRLPLRHRVEAGETAFSIAQLYGVSVTALASWNGIDGDLNVTPGRSLIIPSADLQAPIGQAPVVASAATPQVTAAPIPVATPEATNKPGQTTPLDPPPSATAPLPEDTVEPPTIESPNLAQYRTEVAPVKLGAPVAGTIVKPFNQAPGAQKNDGVDYQTSPGAAVKAADDGEVALISRSLGGLGTIVLVRHQDNLITVYGRVDGVTVQKGDRVSRGQTIGRVADADPPIFHFEVRRATEAVDPTPFL